MKHSLLNKKSKLMKCNCDTYLNYRDYGIYCQSIENIQLSIQYKLNYLSRLNNSEGKLYKLM